MPVNRSPEHSFLEGFFGWGREKSSVPAPNGQTAPTALAKCQRIISFRIGDELDRRIARALQATPESRSEFIRKAIERALKEEGEERLRAAHAAIQWG